MGDDRLNANDRLWALGCGFGFPAATGRFQYERSLTSWLLNVVSWSAVATNITDIHRFKRLRKTCHSFSLLSRPSGRPTLGLCCHSRIGSRMADSAKSGRQFAGLRMATMLDSPSSPPLLPGSRLPFFLLKENQRLRLQGALQSEHPFRVPQYRLLFDERDQPVSHSPSYGHALRSARVVDQCLRIHLGSRVDLPLLVSPRQSQASLPHERKHNHRFQSLAEVLR